jgi:hypothetical protein
MTLFSNQIGVPALEFAGLPPWQVLGRLESGHLTGQGKEKREKYSRHSMQSFSECITFQELLSKTMIQ